MSCSGQAMLLQQQAAWPICTPQLACPVHTLQQQLSAGCAQLRCCQLAAHPSTVIDSFNCSRALPKRSCRTYPGRPSSSAHANAVHKPPHSACMSCTQSPTPEPKLYTLPAGAPKGKPPKTPRARRNLFTENASSNAQGRPAAAGCKQPVLAVAIHADEQVRG